MVVQSHRHGTVTRMVLRMALSISLLLIPVAATWAQNNILIITSGPDAVYNEYARLVKNQLTINTRNTAQIQITSVERVDGKLQFDAFSLIITVGQRAAEQLLSSEPSTRLLLTFIPSQIYFEQAHGRYACKAAACTYLFVDQPPTRQLALMRILFPERKKIGMLALKRHDNTTAAYQRFAKQSGLFGKSLICRRGVVVSLECQHADFFSLRKQDAH